MAMAREIFDVLVLGGGHAGIEAANMVAQFSLSVGIVSREDVPLASTPCNPAIGGVGKGQLVREMDALGGLIGKLADQAGIQFRTLNSSKGPAVQSTRLQIDKERYSEIALAELKNRDHLTIVAADINKIEKSGEFFLLKDRHGRTYSSKILIVTTGTFLGGILHFGDKKIAGGRVDTGASVSLSELFQKVPSLKKKFKTGTPPRINRKSIDFSKMEVQESDPDVFSFHWDHSVSKRFLSQSNCYLTYTNEKTLRCIRENIQYSPIYNGQIEGVGPRYCPSIEDKAMRYPDRNIHHVFVEPEGNEIDTFYPNGVSNCLPVEIQERFLRTIPGLENAEIVIPGYAVEYDVVDATSLDFSLEYDEIPGLFFAGQVNGTSGYEEAAAQGLVAGLNAALKLLNKERIKFSRHDSYIGILIEDLITQERDEPYRLFTARAENRLFTREDNCISRMSKYRKKMGLSMPLDRFQEGHCEDLSILMSLMPIGIPSIDGKTSLRRRLETSGKEAEIVLKKILSEKRILFSERVLREAAVSGRYASFIEKGYEQASKIETLGNTRITWEKLLGASNVSTECKQRIEKFRPKTFGELRLINGIRPATLAYVAAQIS